MTRLQTSFVLGFHGCSAEVGERCLLGEPLVGSDQEYDWLGPGIYFWESDPLRAWEWADEKVNRGKFDNPFVIGAVVDLGNCLDLMSRENLVILKKSYESMLVASQNNNNPIVLPQNRKAGKRDKAKLLRFLDCAVIKHLHEILEFENEEGFDTVRGLFSKAKNCILEADSTAKLMYKSLIGTLNVSKAYSG